jgi:ligand-binding SRPBCC domain-containing protein
VHSYERRTRVDAPLDDVWAFHSRIEGLEALTPGFLNLRVESVVGPDGDEPDVLVEGTRIEMSVRPFGVGPRQSWTSVIVAREEGEGYAEFRDEMLGGPFRDWIHTHRFLDRGDSTVVEDHVEYRLPRGLDRLGALAVVGFEPMFRYRHRRTRQLLGG